MYNPGNVATKPLPYRYSRALLGGFGLGILLFIYDLVQGKVHFVNSAEGYAYLVGMFLSGPFLFLLGAFVINQFRTGSSARKIGAVALVVAIVGGWVMLMRSGSHQTQADIVEHYMVGSEANLKAELPKKLANWLTWTSVTHAGNRQHFHYVVDTAELGITGDVFKASAIPDFTKKMCGNQDTRQLAAMGVVFTYEYIDTAGNPFAEFDISPKQCQ